MSEPTARDRETAAYLMHFVKGTFNYDDMVDVIARALATERARVLTLPPDEAGRIMHGAWAATKLSQGFHRPPPAENPCDKCHRDLVPWDELPEAQKDINRNAFAGLLAAMAARAEGA